MISLYTESKKQNKALTDSIQRTNWWLLKERGWGMGKMGERE